MTARSSPTPRRRLAPVAGVLLALVGLWPVTAQAQTTYVSTLDDPAGGNAKIVGSNWRWAQPFRTGSAAGGYLLHSVAVRFSTQGLTGSGTLVVKLRESASDESPGSVLHTLARTSSVDLNAVNEFTAPAGVVLEADTRYLVELNYSLSSGAPPRWSLAHSPANQNGWQIPAPIYVSRFSRPWSSEDRVFTMAVRATELSPVTLSLSPDTIGEAGGSSTVTASLDAPSSEDTTVTVRATPVSPAAADDYTLSSNLELTIESGDTASAGVVTITSMDNNVYEGDKRVTVSGMATNAQGVMDLRSVTLTITEDEDPPPELSIADASVTEGDTENTTLEFTVTLDRTAPASLTVDWETADGTAEAGTDYTAGGGSLTFSTGEDSKTVSVTVAGDLADEPNETFTVTLSNPSGATLGDATATGTIIDDDDPPTVTLVLTPVSVGESGEVSTVTATLDRPSSALTRVTVSASPVSPAVSGDYTLNRNPVLTIPAGATTSTGTVTIRAVNNDVDAPDKEVTVSATASNSQGITNPQDATLTITDDDDPPAVTLVLTPASIGESGGVSTVTATLDRPSVAATTLRVSTSPVSPAVSGDYALSENLALVIPANSLASTGTVTIRAVNNDVNAPDKEVTVSATASNTQGVTNPRDVTLTIMDDETPPVLWIGDASVVEGTVQGTAEGTASSSTMTFAVTLDRPAPAPVTVDWATSDGTAEAGTDYTADSGSLTFASGETGKTVSVAVVSDAVDEPNETFTVTLSNPSVATVGDGTATGTITDDDGPPAVTLILSPALIGESGGVSTVTATLNRPSIATTTLSVSAAPVWPAVAGDFRLNQNPVLTIPAGATTSTGTVTITAVNNDADAPDKEVTVSATAANARGVTDPDAVTLTITDDDAPPLPVLSIGDASVVEGAAEDAAGDDSGGAKLDFTVTLTPAATRPVTVDWATVDGTAVAGTDYEAGSGTLTFNVGETGRKVSVTVSSDRVDEPDETFTVTLSNAVGAVLGAGAATATGTIEDDDEAPAVTLVLTPDTIGENGGVSTVTATLDHPSSASTTLTVSAAPVSPAVAGEYAQSGRELTFPAGETTSVGVVTITAVDNDRDEPNRSVTVSAAASNGQGITGPRDVTLTITDDDLPLVTVAAEASTIAEGEDAVFVVARAGNAASALTVELDVSEQGGDMVSAALEGMQDVTFEAGAVTAFLRVATADDGSAEPDSQVTVTVSESAAGGGYEVGEPGSATVTVSDGGGVSVLVPGRRAGASALLRRHVDRFSRLTSYLALRRLETRRSASSAAAGNGEDEGSEEAAAVGAAGFATDAEATAIKAAGIATNGEPAGDAPSLDSPSLHWSRTASARPAGSNEDEDGAAAVGPAGPAADVLEIAADSDAADSESTDDRLPVRQRRGALQADAFGVAADAGAAANAEPDDPLSFLLGNRGVSVVDVGAHRGWLTVTGDVVMNLPSVRVTHADSTAVVQGNRALSLAALDGSPPMTAFQEFQGDREAPMASIGNEEGGVAVNGHVRMDLPLLLGARSTSRLDVRVREDGEVRATGDVRVDLPVRSETGEASTLEVRFSENGIAADGDVRVDLPLGWEGWSSLRYTRVTGVENDAAAGSVWDVYAGADYLGESGRTVYGFLVGYEPGRVTSEGVRLEAEHVQFGLYGARRLSESLTLDGALGWGRGDNDLSLIGDSSMVEGGYGDGYPVTASYLSQRFTVRGDLTGDFGWGGAVLRIEPQIGLLYTEEDQDGFTDSLGGAAPADGLWLARVGLGPKLTWSLENSATQAKLRLNLDSHNLGVSDEDREGVSASFELGHRWQINEGSSLGLSVAFDGLGSDWYSSSSLALTFEGRF